MKNTKENRLMKKIRALKRAHYQSDKIDKKTVKMFKKIDTDKSGFIDEQEFITGMKKILPGATLENVLIVFKKYCSKESELLDINQFMYAKNTLEILIDFQRKIPTLHASSNSYYCPTRTKELSTSTSCYTIPEQTKSLTISKKRWYQKWPKMADFDRFFNSSIVKESFLKKSENNSFNTLQEKTTKKWEFHEFSHYSDLADDTRVSSDPETETCDYSYSQESQMAEKEYYYPKTTLFQDQIYWD